MVAMQKGGGSDPLQEETNTTIRRKGKRRRWRKQAVAIFGSPPIIDLVSVLEGGGVTEKGKLIHGLPPIPGGFHSVHGKKKLGEFF